MVYRRSRTNIRKPMRRRATRSGRPSTRRRTVRRTSTRSKACVCPGPPSPGAKFAFAQIDPFHTLATGAKIPDSNTIPSVSNTDVDIVTVQNASNAAWFAAVAFRPQYRGGVVTGSPTVGGVTWGVQYSDNTSNRSKYNLYSAQIELTRPVAHAIRMTSPVAPTTATGFVHIGLATEALTTGSWDYPANPSEMANLQFYRRVTLASLTQSPLTVINKWLDDTGFRYSSSTQTLTNNGAAGALADPQWISFNTDYGWASIIIMLEGTPGTVANVLSVEHLLITEGIPKRTGVLIGTQAAASSPGIMSAVNHVSVNSEPFHNEAEQQGYVGGLLNTLADGAMEAGAQVYQEVVVPLAARAGRVAMSTAGQMAMNAVMGRGGLPGVNSNPNRLALQH